MNERNEYVNAVIAALRRIHGWSYRESARAVKEYGDVFATGLPTGDVADLVARNARGERSAVP